MGKVVTLLRYSIFSEFISSSDRDDPEVLMWVKGRHTRLVFR